jgi:hypothetical protein
VRRETPLRRRLMGSGGSTARVDANALRVARSRAHEENVGGRLTESVQLVVDQGGAEGFGVARSLEGDEVYTPYSRLPSSG